MTDGYVESAFHQDKTIIEFFHPQSNSLPVKLLDQLAQAIHAAGNEK
jgi:methylglutaconyl-CoA hydratase